MTYKELQAKAKEMGLPHVGISKEELEKSIKEAQEAPQETPQAVKSTEKPKESKKPDVNTAIVLDGRREVRRYELRAHGKDFEKLANEFASDRGYQVKLERVEAGIVCPKCGHTFRLKKAIA